MVLFLFSLNGKLKFNFGKKNKTKILTIVRPQFQKLEYNYSPRIFFEEPSRNDNCYFLTAYISVIHSHAIARNICRRYEPHYTSLM